MDEPIASPEDVVADPRSVANQAAVAAEDARMRAARPRTELRARLAVDPRRTYSGEELAGLLHDAILVLPSGLYLDSLPDGIEIRTLVRTVKRRGTAHGPASDDPQSGLRESMEGRR